MHTLMEAVLKFFAVLKDSFQETVDSKILYAMLILSALGFVHLRRVRLDAEVFTTEHPLRELVGSR